MKLELAANLAASQGAQAQPRAHLTISNEAFGYFEVQAPEAVLGRI